MKHLKKFKLFESNEPQQEHPGFPETEDEIHSLCKQYRITNYTINEDLSVDVDGSVWLYRKNLEYLPLKFNKVGDNFYCYSNNLKSLEGCPIEIGGSFSCHDNNLKSLNGCPSVVGGNFYCSRNNLKSLQGCPSVVGVNFNCHSNNLKSLKGCPIEVGGSFSCFTNNIKSLNYFPKNIKGFIHIYNNPIFSLIENFIKKSNKNYLAKEFEFYGIISRDETTVYWLRYTEFCDDYDIELVNIDMVRKDYKVIK